jgi:ADP-heptose:LPS heptosyltransferase
MNIKTQLFIDKIVAKPLAHILNIFVRIVGKILAIDHNLNKEFKTIAICKFKGMGSIIQATPMIFALKKRFPNSKIIFISSKSNQSFLKKITWIDEVVCVDESSFLKFITSNLKALFYLLKNRPEVTFDLEIYSNYSTLFTLFTFSKNRIGFYLRSSSYKMGIYTHMMFFNPRVPISEVYLQLAKTIGCDTEGAHLFSLSENENASEKASKYIIINPNASDLRLERRWNKSNFIELIELILINYPDLEVLLIGSASEKEYTEEIFSKIKNQRLKNLAGKTSIDELTKLIANATLMISNDTGPMHIAFCTKTPIICLFGPCSPDQYGMSEFAHIIYKNAYCSPCVHDFEIPPCKGDNVCMKLISTKEVFSLFQKLNENPTMKSEFAGQEFVYINDKIVLGKVIR